MSISCTLIKDNFYFINAAKLHYSTSIITLPTLKKRQGNESEAERMCVYVREEERKKKEQRERREREALKRMTKSINWK